MKRKLGIAIFVLSIFCFASYAAPAHHSKTIQHKAAVQKKAYKKKRTKVTKRKQAEKIKYLTQLRNQLTQDRDNPTPRKFWFGHIGLAGLINADLQDKSKPKFSKPRSNKILVGPTKLNLDAKINRWVSARFGIFYSSNEEYYYPAASTTTNIDVDDAYITISNLSKTPFYLRAGKQHLPFGKYHRYPILRTLTQQLSETRAPAVQLGFVDQSGLYGAAYIFNGTARTTDPNHDSLNNYGMALGYENLNHPFGFNIRLGYLNNMVDVGAIQNNLSTKYYTNRVSGLSANVDLLFGPFSLMVHHVAAFRKFDSTDFQYTDGGGAHGAKPSATTISTSYRFKAKGHFSKLILSYQWSRHAYNTNGANDALKLPKVRMAIGYGVSILKNTILAFEYDRDRDYNARNGGTNNYNNIASMRLTILI